MTPNSRKQASGGLFMLVLMLTACGGGGGGSSPTAPPVPSPNGTPAPAVMEGSWHTVLAGSGETVTLTLTGVRYRVQRGAEDVSGSISVPGNTIEFGFSTACNLGTGIYPWSISGNSLVFGTGSDPCEGRFPILSGMTYTR